MSFAEITWGARMTKQKCCCIYYYVNGDFGNGRGVDVDGDRVGSDGVAIRFCLP